MGARKGRSIATRRKAAKLNVGPEKPELVIGLVGAVGTPLEFVQSLLKKTLGDLGYAAVDLHLSTYTERFQLQRVTTVSGSSEAQRINSMMDRGNQARQVTQRNNILALMAVADINVRRGENKGPLPGQAFVLRQIKRPEEVHLLRQTYGEGFLLLGLYSPQKSRKTYLKDRGLDDAEIRELIDRDAHEGLGTGQDLRRSFHLADVFLSVGEDQKQTEKDLRRLLDLVFGTEIIAPNVDEFGMFQAYAASLRSAQLGRQVGAAILSENRDLISVGTNEVPSFDGGLYWEDDENDSRDHEYRDRRDSSDQAREDIVREILANVLDDWDHQKKRKQDELTAEYMEKLSATPRDEPYRVR